MVKQPMMTLREGKYCAVFLLTTGLLACGSTQPYPTSSANLTSRNIQPAKAQKKSNVLVIGGESLPYSSVVEQLSAFDLNDKKKNLSLILSILDKDFDKDFENEEFFTVVNKIDPQTENLSFGDFFGLDTSLTSLSKKNGNLFIDSLNDDRANYNLVLGNQSFAMNLEKKTGRIIPSLESSMINNPNPATVELQRDGENVIQTSLPSFRISKEGLAKLTHLTLNLSKENLADPIEIQNPEDQENTAHFILSSWQDKEKGNSAVLITNIVNADQIEFSNLELDKLKKLVGTTLNENTTQWITAKLNLTTQPHTITVWQMPITVKVIDEKVDNEPDIDASAKNSDEPQTLSETQSVLQSDGNLTTDANVNVTTKENASQTDVSENSLSTSSNNTTGIDKASESNVVVNKDVSTTANKSSTLTITKKTSTAKLTKKPVTTIKNNPVTKAKLDSVVSKKDFQEKNDVTAVNNSNSRTKYTQYPGSHNPVNNIDINNLPSYYENDAKPQANKLDSAFIANRQNLKR